MVIYTLTHCFALLCCEIINCIFKLLSLKKEEGGHKWHRNPWYVTEFCILSEALAKCKDGDMFFFSLLLTHYLHN